MSVLGFGTVFFSALDKGLGIYDRVHKTKFQKQFVDIWEKLSTEEARPIYHTGHEKRRDQNVIDHLNLEMTLMLRGFAKHVPKEKV